MPIPRFRTTTLMIAVAAPGVAIAGLRHASDLWASGLFTTTLLLLASATLVAIGTPRDLHRWGLAAFGSAYLLVSLLPDGRAQLTTSRLFEPLYFTMHAKAQPTMLVYPSPVPADLVLDGKHYATNPTYPGQAPLIHSWPWRGGLEAFERVGHSLCALLAACLGAGIGVLLTARRDRRPA